MGAFLQRKWEEGGYMKTPWNMDSQLASRIVLHDFANDAWITDYKMTSEIRSSDP